MPSLAPMTNRFLAGLEDLLDFLSHCGHPPPRFIRGLTGLVRSIPCPVAIRVFARSHPVGRRFPSEFALPGGQACRRRNDASGFLPSRRVALSSNDRYRTPG